MNKELEKELKLRISMLEAKVEILLEICSKHIHTNDVAVLEQNVEKCFEQQEIENEMHSDMMGLTS